MTTNSLPHQPDPTTQLLKLHRRILAAVLVLAAITGLYLMRQNHRTNSIERVERQCLDAGIINPSICRAPSRS